MNELLVALRTNLIANATVRGLVADRCYPAHIATLPNVTFPCACFALVGGSLDRDVSDFGIISANIWAWSMKHYEQSWEIYNAIFAVLDHNNISAMVGAKTIRAVLRETARPIQAYDEIEKVYYLMGTWEARCLKS